MGIASLLSWAGLALRQEFERRERERWEGAASPALLLLNAKVTTLNPDLLALPAINPASHE